jgi:hypothetical protein
VGAKKKQGVLIATGRRFEVGREMSCSCRSSLRETTWSRFFKIYNLTPSRGKGEVVIPPQFFPARWCKKIPSATRLCQTSSYVTFCLRDKEFIYAAAVMLESKKSSAGDAFFVSSRDAAVCGKHYTLDPFRESSPL